MFNISLFDKHYPNIYKFTNDLILDKANSWWQKSTSTSIWSFFLINDENCLKQKAKLLLSAAVWGRLFSRLVLNWHVSYKLAACTVLFLCLFCLFLHALFFCLLYYFLSAMWKLIHTTASPTNVGFIVNY